MSDTNSLKKLKKRDRDLLLLTEMWMWLHMLGKLHEDFLHGNHDMDRELPKDIKDDFPDLYALLTKPDAWTDSTGSNRILSKFSLNSVIQAGGTSILSVIQNHRPPNPKTTGFLKLIQDAHGRGSGTEKGQLVGFAPGQASVYLATSLGYESPYIISPPIIYALRQSLYECLQGYLQAVQTQFKNLKSGDQIDLQEWKKIRAKFIKRLEQTFRVTVAESRRPLNDVTLFDQTLMSVAFFKSALAQNILTGQWKDPLPKGDPLLKTREDKYRWRLLRIGLDSATFWGTSLRIGDLLARKECVTDALNEVQGLLEVTYPLGTEVYRDENGSAFIIPDVENLQKYVDEDEAQSLEEQIQDIAKRAFDGEAEFTIFPSGPTRGTLLFGELVTRSFQPPIPEVDWLQKQWENAGNDVCPVCNLRPQGPGEKSRSRKVCDICEERREERSEKWTKELSSTIWIDEVADVNGRLALLIGQFNIADWLQGNSFNTILSLDPGRHTLTESSDGKAQVFEFEYNALISAIQNGLELDQEFKDDLLGKLVPVDLRDDRNRIIDFYYYYLSDTDLEDSSSASKPEPERLALALLRLRPSPARLSRTWTASKMFWEGIVTDLHTIIGKSRPRLRIKGSFTDKAGNLATLSKFHTYNLNIDSVNLSIACIGDGSFLTVDNLDRTVVLLGLKKEENGTSKTPSQLVSDRLKGKQFRVEEPTGYGGPDKVIGILSVESVSGGSSYIPIIPILTDPRTFMVFVPADKAMNVAKAIKEKYEQEVGRVRNRLPLKLGIVVAEQRTPLPAILSAGRRLLNQPTSDQTWRVVGIEPRSDHCLFTSWPGSVTLTLQRNGQSLPIKVPTTRGDGKTKDVWYPYWCVEKDANNAPPSGRERQFKGVDGKEWIHICDLQEGDVVHLQPSRFDFEFLDTAARRFEISYDASGKRRGRSHPARPYYLEQLDEFEMLWNVLFEGLETTQIDNLVGLIEEKRMEWLADHNDEGFKQTVHDILNNANWRPLRRPKPESETFEQLYRAALSGQLADVVEVYMRILKRQTKADKSQIEIGKTGGNV
jgi:CRISPR-associated Csx11 family protein